jgi:hypothetical protein
MTQRRFPPPWSIEEQAAAPGNNHAGKMFSVNSKAAGHKTDGFALSPTCRVLGRHFVGMS